MRRKAIISLVVSVFCVLPLFGQNLTVNYRSKSVDQIISDLESRTNYTFVYQKNELSGTPAITVSLQNAPFADVLGSVCSKAGLSYEIVKNSVILHKGIQTAEAQNVKVFGKVTDRSGMPVIGASVFQTGTTNGVSTDSEGNYSLTVANGALLTFSCIGYADASRLAVDGAVNVVLEDDISAIEETVVVGYGTMKKVDLTGSIAKADLSSVKTAPNTNILEAIKGQVPGLNIGQVNTAGSNPDLEIRGQITLGGNTTPLIILDGVVYNGNITDLNPGDIESIDVLKDASSKAVYGARGANGVVMITSKGGREEKAPSVTYSNNWSWSTPTRDYRSSTRDEYLANVRNVNWKSAFTPESSYLEPNPSWKYENDAPVNNTLVQGYLNGTDYDWYSNLSRKGHLHTNSLNVAGGTKKVSYYISGSYTDQGTIILNDDYKRTTFRANVDVQITDWLKIGTNTFAAFSDYSGVCPNISSIYLTPAIVGPKDEDGHFVTRHTGGATINPFISMQADDDDKRTQLNTTAYALISFPFLEGLTYRLNYNYTGDYSWHSYFNEYDASETGLAYKEYDKTGSWLLDNILNYTRSFGKHNVNATLVYGANKIMYDYGYSEGSQFSNMTLGYNAISQAIVQSVDADAWSEESLYQMGRLAYNYDGRYYFTATVRRDGFSGFAANHKFGIFPSIGVAWNISREPWMEDCTNLSNLKIRASWGITGNQTQRYSSLAKVSVDQDYAYVFGNGASMSPGFALSDMANGDLKWETTKEVNVGVDFGFWDNRLYGSVDLYSSKTTNLLWPVSLPSMTGFTSVNSNLGEIDNKGIEISLGATPVKSGDFQWNVNVNFSANKNRITSLLGEDNDGDGKEDDLISSDLFIGQSIGTIYGYQTDGIYQVEDMISGTIPSGFEPGAYKVVDQDGDGSYTLANDRIILGHKEPAFIMGIRNQFIWKGFDFNFFINVINGGKNGYMAYNKVPSGLATTSNASQGSFMTCYDYWCPSNPDATFAAAWSLDGGTGAQLLQSRSFLRLQDISLGYTFGGNWMQKAGIHNLRAFVSGKNLLTLTKWDGWDPETGDGIGSLKYPTMRTLAFGIDLTF